MSGPRTLRLAWSHEESPVLVPALIAMVLVTSFLFFVGVIANAVIAVVALLPLLVSGTWLFFRARRRRGGTLELADDGSLALRQGFNRVTLSRDEVTGLLAAGPMMVRLDTRRGRPIRLGFDRETDSDGTPVLDLLRAHLALGSGQRALSLSLRPMIGAFSWSFIIGAFLDGVLVLGWQVARLLSWPHQLTSTETSFVFVGLLLLVPFGIAPYAGRGLAFSRLTVGEDGVLVRRFVFRRLLRYRQLARVEVALGDGIRFTEVSGKQHVHHAFGQGATELSGMVSQIRLQIARYTENAEPTGDALARGGRAIAEWRRALAELARGGGSFRQATMAPEVLHRIVVDAAAPLDQRVGAALALRDVDPTAGPRVRLAAEGSAEPRVRLALEATLGAEEQLDEELLDRATRASFRR